MKIRKKQDLRSMQAAPLQVKIAMTERRINDWIREFGEDGVYVSFSGGKDSTVLLDLVRKVNRNIPAVFVNTGLEYPEIRKFALDHENVIEIRPRWGRMAKKYGKNPEDIITFRDTLECWGYPIISKSVSYSLTEARRKPYGGGWKQLYGQYNRKDGRKSLYDYSKYLPLYDLPIKISNKCCDVNKKRPAHIFRSQTKRKPIIGTMAYESAMRAQAWLKTGCNSFDSKNPMSKPISFWLQQDILRYVYDNKLQICSVYGDIILLEDENNDNYKFECTGCDRTGCIYCAFGLHLEKGETRFQKLKRTHPHQYDYCMRGGTWKKNENYDLLCTNKELWNPKELWVPSKDGLGMAKVFDMINDIYGKNFIRYE